MMKTYKILIKEVVIEEFEIEATSIEQAISKSITDYKNGELVLEPGELIATYVTEETMNNWEEI